MKRCLFCFSLLVFHFSLVSQQHVIDSLRHVLKTDKEDTNKVNHLNALAYTFYTVNPDTTILLAQQAASLSRNINWTKGEANAYRQAGIGYWAKGDYPKALDYYLKALKMAEEMGNKELQAKTLGNIGLVYRNEGDYPKALDYNLKALKMAEEMGDKNFQAKNLINIGVIYYNQGDCPKALDYNLKALKMAEEMRNKQLQAIVLCDIGNIYYYQGNYLKALDYYPKALKMDEEMGSKSGMAGILGNIGVVYENQGDYTKALDYCQKALKMAEEMGDKSGMARNLGDIGQLYSKTGKFKESEEYLKKAIALDSSIGEQKTLKDAEEYISHLYDTTGHYKLALTWYKKAMVLKDTLFNMDRNKALTRKEMTYQFEEKEASEKAEQDKKDALAEADKRKQKIIIWSIGGGLLLVLVFAGFIFRSLRVTRKQKHIIEIKNKETEAQKALIEQQKALVEEKNKDITDSIHYASRIQRALLTSDGYIGKYLKEYFILFKPRDIVSGDFYWAFQAPPPPEGGIAANNENPLSGCNSGVGSFHIACCDCTGHGVPGAFMSLLNISMLNETIVEKNITRPDLVLNDVRANIIKALNPEGLDTGSKDGMDCILCSFNWASNTVNFACANNSPWLIRNNECIDYKADKMPVGMQGEKNIPFALQSVPLQKGDLIYMFTDGYADQFGGPKGKKFKYKQLQQLIMDNCQLTMDEQKQVLERAIEDWKGSLEQVDDILIIGIRV
ncbi:MAG: tetratricopeptide repeat protein [Bacteroidia bacterium]